MAAAKIMMLDQISPKLVSLIRVVKDKRFSLSQIRDGYLSDVTSQYKTRKSSYQYIYRNILRLEKIGLIERSAHSKGKGLEFVVLPAFFEVYNTEEIEAQPSSVEPSFSSTPEDLEKKLKLYELELIYVREEGMEYERFLEESPSMEAELEGLYYKACDRTAKLMGKIAAVKQIIALRASAQNNEAKQ